MARRSKSRRRRRLDKPEKAAKARWYASRGYSYGFIAEKTGTHRNSVSRWCASNDNRALDRLAVRLRNLSAAEYQELLQRVRKRTA